MKQPIPEFYGSTVVSDKGQVVIPAEARNALGLTKGEKLLVMGMNGESLMLVKAGSFERMAAEMSAKMQVIKEKVAKEGDEKYEHCD